MDLLVRLRRHAEGIAEIAIEGGDVAEAALRHHTIDRRVRLQKKARGKVESHVAQVL